MHSFADHTRPINLTSFSVGQQEQVEGWARTQRASSYVFRPTTVEEVREVLSLARSHGRTVVLRGGGHSYYDAALNAEGITMNLSRMCRLLEWDPQQGIIRVEPGVTIGDLWRVAVADGWWPEVLPGTTAVTLGGCLAMNIHSKNAWKMGSLGEQVLALELLLASGQIIQVTPSSDPALFHAVIGGLGMLGVITSITLQLQPIRSAKLLVRQRPARSLSEMFAIFAEEAPQADYLEGLIDGYACVPNLGRGFVKCARFSSEFDRRSLPSLALSAASASGMVPPEFLGRALRPLLNMGSRLSNKIHYRQRVLRRGSGHTYHIPLARFHFRPDGVFWFLRSLIPAGTRTIQPFIPAQQAPAVFTEMLERSQRAGLVPFWCCLKKHRADPFLLSCLVDGFSLELSYPITAQNAKKLALLLAEMLGPIIAAGGRLYLAKDDVLDTESYAQSMGIDRVESFIAIKHAYDPQSVFQSGLYRRIFVRDHERLTQEEG